MPIAIVAHPVKVVRGEAETGVERLVEIDNVTHY